VKNIQDIVNAGQCIGCAACYGICPKGHIGYKEDGGMGFPVPKIEDCENCGACLKVCPNSDEYEDED